MIVLTLWVDLIKANRPGYSYSDFGMRSVEWQTTTGNKARKRHIQTALDNAQGRFRPVYARAVETEADPRAIKSCEPEDVWWRVDKFDPVTGEFSAAMIE